MNIHALERKSRHKGERYAPKPAVVDMAGVAGALVVAGMAVVPAHGTSAVLSTASKGKKCISSIA